MIDILAMSRTCVPGFQSGPTQPDCKATDDQKLEISDLGRRGVFLLI